MAVVHVAQEDAAVRLFLVMDGDGPIPGGTDQALVLGTEWGVYGVFRGV